MPLIENSILVWRTGIAEQQGTETEPYHRLFKWKDIQFGRPIVLFVQCMYSVELYTIYPEFNPRVSTKSIEYCVEIGFAQPTHQAPIWILPRFKLTDRSSNQRPSRNLCFKEVLRIIAIYNRVAAGFFPAFLEHISCVLRGLGRSLNKQKPGISERVEMPGFVPLYIRRHCLPLFYKSSNFSNSKAYQKLLSSFCVVLIGKASLAMFSKKPSQISRHMCLTSLSSEYWSNITLIHFAKSS